MQTNKLDAYFQLTKPGVTLGNVLTVVAGYFLAAAGKIEVLMLVGVTLGMTFVIAGACALNNFLDSDIDAKMARTKQRPSVLGTLPPAEVILLVVSLTALGIAELLAFTNILTVTLAIIGFVVYVWFYGVFAKRKSVHGTIVGSISGAVPIIAGYAAARGRVDIGMSVAFLVLFFWQFSEFYSIAIYRRDEYAKAKVPVISVVKGVTTTTRWIIVYTVLYVLATLALTPLGYTGWIYFVIMLIAGVYWIRLALDGLGTDKPELWARSMFKTSMSMIVLLCFMLSIGSILP